jgi:hypothetical protein
MSQFIDIHNEMLSYPFLLYYYIRRRSPRVRMKYITIVVITDRRGKMRAFIRVYNIQYIGDTIAFIHLSVSIHREIKKEEKTLYLWGI